MPDGCKHSSALWPTARRGFSFAEVLFAVMILGIGFIMIAAIFPVAIKQTALTGEESIAAAIAREATGTLTSLDNSIYMPPTVPGPGIPPGAVAGQRAVGQVWSFHDLTPADSSVDPVPNWNRSFNWTDGTAQAIQAERTWNAVRGNLILPFDQRFAWVAMYRRDGFWLGNGTTVTGVYPEPFAQVIVIGVQIRNRSAYQPVDVARSNSTNPPYIEPATLEPKLMNVRMVQQPTDGTRTITFLDFPQIGRLAEGSFVVISDDRIYQNPSPSVSAWAGLYNGHVYRLGNYRPDLSTGTAKTEPTYELAPGYDAFPEKVGPQAGLANAAVYLIGRNYVNPASPYLGVGSSTPQFEGPAQDIAIYTTYMHVN